MKNELPVELIYATEIIQINNNAKYKISIKSP